MRRGLTLWLVLVAAYGVALAVRAPSTHRLSAPEAHRMLVAGSIVRDGDVDVANDYALRRYRSYYAGTLRPAGGVEQGRRLEPAGLGTPLLIAPAKAIGGVTAARLWCAAWLALAFVLAAALARRVVPEPWATRATLAVALSPPALAASTTLAPEPFVAALIAGAALLALGVRERPVSRGAIACAALLAPVPWLSVRAVPAAVVVALALFEWLRRRRRAVAGFFALDVLGTSAVAFVSINDRLFGGFVPSAIAPGDPTASDYLARVPQLLGVLAGLRWAPVLLLAGVGAWLLWRSRRDRLAAALPGRVEVEATATLCLALAVVALVCGALGLASPDGPTLVAPDVVVALAPLTALTAWGLRVAPRAGALLTAATLVASVAWVV